MEDYQPSNDDNTSEDSYFSYSKQPKHKRKKSKSAVRKKTGATISVPKKVETVKQTSASASKPTASVTSTAETSITKASPDVSKTAVSNLSVDRVIQIFSQARDFFELKLSGQTKSKLLIKSQIARLTISEFADQDFVFHDHIISDQTLRNCLWISMDYVVLTAFLAYPMMIVTTHTEEFIELVYQVRYYS